MAHNREYDAGGARSSAGPAAQGAGGISLIDRDSYFSGTYRSPRDLYIEGEYEGEIECEGTVVIADSARVTGTINADSAQVSGQLQGQVTCSGRFEILASGQVAARVLAGAIVVHEGAFYEGEMRMHVEPEGLPAREVTGVSAAATPTDTAVARLNRRRQNDAEESPAEPDAVPALANGRAESGAPTLRAVSDG